MADGCPLDRHYGQSEFEDRAEEVLSEMIEDGQESVGEDTKRRLQRLHEEKQADAGPDRQRYHARQLLTGARELV